MSYELVYTSAPRGLKQSAGGYCTVAADGGLPRSLAMKLEMLSPYQFHYKLTDADVSKNPVNYSHTIISSGGEMHSVLSRVAFCGTDYSGRINKLAHHFLLTHDEKELPIGPARMLKEMERLELFAKRWEKKPEALASRRLNELLAGVEPNQPHPAQAWAQLGDAGWAGELARAFRTNKKIPAYIIFEPGMEILPLYEESLALLPPQERWHVCFSTYYTSLPPNADCHWRAVLAGTQAAKEISRYPQAVVIDITKPLPPAPDNEFTQAAMTGAVVYAAQGSQPAGENVSRASAAPSAIEEKIRKARERIREAEPIEISEYETAKIKSLQYLPDNRRKTPLALTVALGVIAAILLVTNAVTFREMKESEVNAVSRQEQLDKELASAKADKEKVKKEPADVQEQLPETGGAPADPKADADTAADRSDQPQEAAETTDQQAHEPEQETPEGGNAEDTKEQPPDEKHVPAEDGPQSVILAERKVLEIDKWDDPEILQPIPSNDNKVIRFKLHSRPTHVVQVPDAIATKIGEIKWTQKGDNFKLAVGSWDIGVMTFPDGEQWLMQFRKQDNLDTTEDGTKIIDAFVIELADSEKVYQCPLGQLRPVEQVISLELNEEKKVKKPPVEKISYPWDSEESKPVFNGKPFSVHANIPTDDSFFARFRREKGRHLYFELVDKKPLPKELSDLVSKMEEANKKIIEAKNKIDEVIKELSALPVREGKRFPSDDAASHQEAFRKVGQQLDAANESNKLFIGVVHDPWGPLLRVYLKVVAEPK